MRTLRIHIYILTGLLLLSGCIVGEEKPDTAPNSPESSSEGGDSPEASNINLTEKPFASFNSPTRNLTVHFIDVGQGDSILIQLPNGNEILVDGGVKGKGDEVVEYMRSHGIDDLEVVVSSSPDADHLGGLLYVLQNFDVKKVVESGQSHTTKTYADYLAVLKVRNLSVKALRVGDNLDIDPSVTISVLSPPDPLFKGTRSDTNSNSVVLLLDYNNTQILLTGDAEAVTEDFLLNNQRDIDVLKVAHHGSRYSTTWRFLTAFSPEVGVISVGCGNPYGHPHNETLERLTMLGVEIFTTCMDGDITVTTDGVDYAIVTDTTSLASKDQSENASVDVEICRVVYDPTGPEPDNEVITLCNKGGAIDLGGWVLSDGEGSYVIPEGTVLSAEGEWSIYGSTYNPSRNPKGLFLNNRHDEVLLLNPKGELADVYAW